MICCSLLLSRGSSEHWWKRWGQTHSGRTSSAFEMMIRWKWNLNLIDCLLEDQMFIYREILEERMHPYGKCVSPTASYLSRYSVGGLRLSELCMWARTIVLKAELKNPGESRSQRDVLNMFNPLQPVLWEWEWWWMPWKMPGHDGGCQDTTCLQWCPWTANTEDSWSAQAQWNLVL